MIEDIIKLINAYWRFDESQQPMSSWHEKQDLLDEIRRIGESIDTDDYRNSEEYRMRNDSNYPDL